ncbi:nucleotide disphospho-sugar-binding domain-containing protein [Nonomuraea sp. NPDC049158]|uniref:nucleotide disphospho-sugar-binding domain-containing protein n=1 Tax=Nonomuraea sp. NPDC049158 TaxID=3155649 RepID=UPI00340789AD
MRVLFAVIGWPTHYYPMVPLAWAFRAAGHEVRVASTEGLSEAIVASGMAPVRVGADVDLGAMYRSVLGELRDPEQGQTASLGSYEQTRDRGLDGANAVMQRIQLAVTETMVPELAEFARCWRPDVVVWDSGTFAGGVVARHLGSLSVRHTWGPDIVRASGLDSQWIPGFQDLFRRFGVAEEDGLDDLTVDPCPNSLQVVDMPERLPVRYVPYNGPGGVPRWLWAPPEGPRVCVTWGTGTTHVSSEELFLVPQILQALAGTDVEVVVAVNPNAAARLEAVPGNVRVVEMLPLNLLLPTCSAIVHQGGGGTTLTAALMGVPQLVLPQLPDQYIGAAKLAEIGAGREIGTDESALAALGKDLAAVLDDPGYGAAATRLREEMLAQKDYGQIAGELAARALARA